MKKFLAALAAAVLTVVGFTYLGASPAGAAPAAGYCSPTMFVVAGWGQDHPAAILNSAPAGYRSVNITYPNQMPWDPNPFHNVQVGVDQLNWQVNQLYDTCGNIPVIITGYSLGAIVAGDVLQTQPAHRNIQGVLFSDARRLPAYPGDPGGLEALFPFNLAVPGDGLRGFNHPTLQLCFHLDPICVGTWQNAPNYFFPMGPDQPTAHGAYSFDVAFELGLHGWGNHKNIVY